MNFPLKGIRVIELSSYVAVPTLARIMADFGAEVIKIESFAGDGWRGNGKAYKEPVTDEENPTFTFPNANKKFISVNTTDPRGREILLHLLKDCDVFLTNMLPKSLKKMNLNYEAVKEVNPKIVYCDFSAYGDVGAKAGESGFDSTAFWGSSGLALDAVSAESFPMRMPAAAGDLVSCMALLSGVMIALYGVKQTGVGTRVTSALFWNGLWMANVGVVAVQYGHKYPFDTNNPPSTPVSFMYQCSDGEWISMALNNFLTSPERMDKLFELLYIEEHRHDPRFASADIISRNKPAMTKIIRDSIAKHTITEWEERFSAFGAAFTPLPRFESRYRDEQALENGFFEEVHFKSGNKIMMPTPPIHLTEYAKKSTNDGLPGRIGRDTNEVLLSRGYDEKDLKELYESGVLK